MTASQKHPILKKCLSGLHFAIITKTEELDIEKSIAEIIEINILGYSVTCQNTKTKLCFWTFFVVLLL